MASIEQRTFEEMIEYFITQVRRMKIKNLDKMALVGIISAIQTKHEMLTHGKWIEHVDGWGNAYYDCSVCGESWTTIEGTPMQNGMKYCPNCGARMDG